MTNQETIANLNMIKVAFVEPVTKEQRKLIDDTFDNAIKALEQEPKTGHWIWCVGSHKCSNCEEYTCFSHKELLRYCPNCGAKMVEPRERSE